MKASRGPLAAVSGIAPSPASCAAAARGAVALAVPLLLGVWTGAVVPSVVAGIGALWGVGQDGFDPYHHRVRRLGGMGLCAAAGLLAGELALRSGHPAAVTVCLVAAALVAGAVGLRGRIGAVCGMHLLLGVTVGGGIPVPGPWWHAPLALLAGVLLVVVLSAAPWLWRRHDVERAAVLAVYRAAAAALSAAGTPAAEDARRRLTAALDHAHHVMDRHLTHDGREQPERAALREAFDTAVRLGEVTSALLWEGRPLPARAIEVPALLAARLLPAAGRRAGRADAGLPAPADARAVPGPEPDTPGLRALAALAARADRAPSPALPARLPTAPRHGRAARVRYSLLLALCVLLAQVCAEVLHEPRGYWLPMTVAFVYQPDFGPVARRALHRVVGTVVGVAALGTVALLTQNTYALIGAVAAFAALMAVGVRRHYALATTGLTAIVLVLVDLLGDHRQLYGPRILDTALACAIVLVAHLVLWPRSAAQRAVALTEAAVGAAQRYGRLADEVPPAQRHALRRTAYHLLAEARRAVDHARGEPGRRGRDLPSLQELAEAVTTAERLCDAVSARTVAARPVVRPHPVPRCAPFGPVAG